VVKQSIGVRRLFESIGNPMANLANFSVADSLIAERCQRAEEIAASLMIAQPALNKKVCRAVFCGPDEATIALSEAIKFIWLASETNDGPLTPSHRVDLVWHELILFTRAYQQLCEDQFDKFVHHQPSGLGDGHHQPLAKTLTRYQEMFGVPREDFWGTRRAAGSTCGTCESNGA
jgi:hypothetical protein